MRTPDQRLAWMVVVGTIPVGLVGAVAEHPIRVVLGRPIPAAIFLIVNGGILYGAELLRRHTGVTAPVRGPDDDGDDAAVASDGRLAAIPVGQAVLIGSAQIFALAAGISRSGVTMVAGMARGLSHEDAARFSFLLATPVILAAGVLKLPDLFGPAGNGIRLQVLFGSVLSGLGAYVSVRFLVRWFHTRTLIPFAVYCAAAGTGSLLVFAARGSV